MRSMPALAAILLPAAAAAQAPPPAPMPMVELRTFVASSEIQAMIARASTTIKLDEPVLVQPLLILAPYKANLEYRQAATGSAVHLKEAEIFYVVEGAGTLTVGGTMLDPKPVDPLNQSGTGISGGKSQPVAAGDMLIVPENTPHWFNKVQGRLVMVAMKIPRGGMAGR